MNRERDIDRVLEAWLAPGPTAMPDRLFDGVLDRIERQPQRRLARLQLRFSTMRPIMIFAAAAAIAVAVFAGIVLLGRPSTPDAGTPTPAPSVAPTATASPRPAAGLPDEVTGTWFGAPRALPASGVGLPALLELDLGTTGSATQLRVGLVGSWRYGSRGASTAPGQLRFDTTLPNLGCDVGATGEYVYTQSPDGRTLDLSVVDEPCEGRGEAFAGTWTLHDCRLPENPNGYVCAGVLSAGTHASTFFDPWSPSLALTRTGDYGRLRFTVPAGWANREDSPTSFFLVPAEEYAKDDGGDLESWHGIYVWRRAAAMAQDDACGIIQEPGVPTTLDALTRWLTEHPGLVTTEPVEITIGGKRATMTDTAIAPDWTTTCPDAEGGHPVAHMFLEAGTGRWDWATGWPGNQDRQRVILVEVEPENVMLIAIDDTNSQESFDALVAEAMPIVESFEFPE